MMVPKVGGADDVDIAWRIQGPVYAVAFFGHGGGQMMAVLVPLFAAGLEVSPVLIGIALGARHLPSLFLSIPSGGLMDRMGTRQVLIYFSLIGMLIPPLYPAMPWIPALIVLQMALGFITGLNWQGAQTLIGQLMHGSPRYSARLTIANGIGSLTSPLIIGIAWDYLGPWGAFMILSLYELILLVSCMTLPKTNDGLETDGAMARIRGRDLVPRLSDYLETFRLLGIPAVAFVVLVSMLDHCAVGVHQSFYVVYLERIGLSGTAIGTLASVASLASITGSMCTGRVAGRVNHYWLLLIGLTLSISAIAVTPLLGLYTLLMAAAVVRGFTTGLVYPMVFAIMARSVGPGEQGRAVGLRSTGNRVAGVFVPVLMGAVASEVGLENSFLVIGGFLIASMVALGLYVRRAPAFQS